MKRDNSLGKVSIQSWGRRGSFYEGIPPVAAAFSRHRKCKYGGTEQLLGKNNCLNLIRLLAAAQVMFGHMVEHLELPINPDLFRVTYFLRGVPVFFAISGFLMWFSIGRSRNYEQYLKKRFWRIYPELWGAVIVEILILVLLYRGWNPIELVCFIFGQGTIFQFWTPDSLRGYGVGTPNGALWTIGVMIQYYIIAWFFYRLMKDRKPVIWIIGFVVSFVVSWLGAYVTHNLLGKEIIGKLYDQTFVYYFWLFYIGMFMAEFKSRLLPTLEKWWPLMLAVAFAFFWTKWDLFSGYYLGWSLFLAAGVIGFAYKYPGLTVGTDISYGLFLYHMTVINIFVHFGWIGKWVFSIPVMLISALLAYLSTVTLGRLSAKKKQEFVQQRVE